MSERGDTPGPEWNVTVDGDVLLLSGTIDFRTARVVLESISSKLHSGGPGIIDLAAVSRINSAGLAVLIESLSVARKQGLELRYRNMPAGLRDLAGVCQVDELLPMV